MKLTKFSLLYLLIYVLFYSIITWLVLSDYQPPYLSWIIFLCVYPVLITRIFSKDEKISNNTLAYLILVPLFIDFITLQFVWRYIAGVFVFDEVFMLASLLGVIQTSILILFVIWMLRKRNYLLT